MDNQHLAPIATQPVAPQKSKTIPVLLWILGIIVAFFILIVLTVVIIFATAGPRQRSTLIKEMGQFSSYPEFVGWNSSRISEPYINILCLDQCSFIGDSFSLKDSGKPIEQDAESMKQFLKSRGYDEVSLANGCGQEWQQYSCTVYGRKGSLQTSIDLSASKTSARVQIKY